MTKFNTYLESNDFDRLKRFFEEHGELQHYRKGNFLQDKESIRPKPL